jgi:hypothetical protein
VAGRQSGVPFDSVPSHARCILAYNNTGRAWAIVGLRTRPKQMIFTNEYTLGSMPAFGAQQAFSRGGARVSNAPFAVILSIAFEPLRFTQSSP